MIRYYNGHSSHWPSSDASDIPRNDRNALEHFGVKGMKWGVRKDRKSSRPRDPESQFVKDVRKKKVSTLSNEDLRRASNRLQLEVNYTSLKKQREAQSLGGKIVQKVGKQMGDKTASAIANTVVNKGMKYTSLGLRYFLKTRGV